MSQTQSRRLVVMGASMGGIEALVELLPQIPADFPAPILIVIHTTALAGGDSLSRVLERSSKLAVGVAADLEELQAGKIYLPPSDHHLLVQDGRLRVSHGPRENNTRPAIDPLFRSAAFYARQDCIGVLLSGLLDDGSNGLLAIQRSGGTTLVQDPSEARYPDMPTNALRLSSPSHVLPLAEIGPKLVELVSHPGEQNAPPIPSDLAVEVLLTQRAMGLEDHDHDMELNAQVGELVPLTCPDCGGTLWQSGEHYRCHVGHAYSSLSLLDQQDRTLEEALWAACRALEEKRKLLEKLLRQEVSRQRTASQDLYRARAEDAQRYADRIREMLFRMARQS